METDKTDADPDIKTDMVTGVDGDAGTGDTAADPAAGDSKAPVELNGPKGPEPTRYGDWEQKGRCSDF